MAGGPAGKIFINYRRGEDSAAAGRLYDRLEQDFAKDDLFMDVDDIAAGQDFVAVLERQLAGCDAFLAVIGRSWLDAKDAEGNRRLDNPNDFVRIEIASALRLGKRVIPVLVNDGRMPSADALPEPLKPLSRRNAVRLTHERFKADAHGLLNGLKAALAEAEAERAAHTESERRAAEAARKAREAEEEARAAQVARETAERAKAGLTPEEIRKAEELANWDFIKDRRNAEDLRDHLARFAGGATDRYARAKLEALVWANPATQGSIETLRTYLDEFPKGDNAGAAKTRLEVLERERDAAQVAKEEKRAETEAWAKVAASAEIVNIEAFLKEWPKGVHVADAKARIRELRGSRFSRRGVLKGFGIGAVVTATGGSIVSSAITPGEFIWRKLHDQSVRTFTAHMVHSVAISPDGRTALLGSWDKTLKLWDIASGREIRSFTGHTSSVHSVVISPDGRYALSSGGASSGFGELTSGELKLWDIASGREIRSFSGHKADVNSVSISSDGRTALSGGGDVYSSVIELKLWDIASGRELRSLTGHTDIVLSVAISPDGRSALSGSRDKTLKLWDIGSGRMLRSFTGHTNAGSSVVFSPDGRAALSGSSDHTLKLWDIASSRETSSFTGHTGLVESSAVSPDGRIALSAGG